MAIEMAQKNKQPNFFVRIGYAIKDYFVSFGKRFRDGSIGTKISHFIFGAGSFYNGQIIKGCLFLGLQAIIILFMVLCPEVNETPFGYKALGNLVLGGQETSIDPITAQTISATDDKLRLLFGLVTIAAIVLYILIWLSNIKSSYKADMDRKIGKKL